MLSMSKAASSPQLFMYWGTLNRENDTDIDQSLICGIRFQAWIEVTETWIACFNIGTKCSFKGKNMQWGIYMFFTTDASKNTDEEMIATKETYY